VLQKTDNPSSVSVKRNNLTELLLLNGYSQIMGSSQHVYEVRPRRDGRGFDLISVRYDAEFSALCKEMRLKLTKG